MGQYINIDAPDGSFKAYIARPEAAAAPAVVVLQEIFGVNADLRETCDWLALHGFIAICPDLFWRQEPGVDLSAKTEAEWKKGFELYTAFNIDNGVNDIMVTVDAARSLKGCTGKVGLTGFCLGGLMTFITASRKKIDAAVAYYGGRTEEFLRDAETLHGPLMMHLAEEDEYIGKDAQRAIKLALQHKDNVELHSYPGCNHAFARHQGAHFDANAAELANSRTLRFFRTWLS